MSEPFKLHLFRVSAADDPHVLACDLLQQDWSPIKVPEDYALVPCESCGERFTDGWECLEIGKATRLCAGCVLVHDRPSTHALVAWEHIESLARQSKPASRLVWESGEQLDRTPLESWRVTLRRKDSDGEAQVLTTIFNKGSKYRYEHDGETCTAIANTLEDPGVEPDAATVLNRLLEEASAVIGFKSFEEWALATDHDPDSIRAEATYKRGQRTLDRLYAFLGEALKTYLAAERS